jgi:hypothetical protein
MKQLFDQLPAIVQSIMLLLIAVVTLCTAISAVCKAFGWQRGTALFAAWAVDIGKFIAVLQGFVPQNKPPEQVEQKAIVKDLKTVGLISVALLLSGCGILGTPKPKTGQCFDYCLVVVIEPTQGEAAVCYDTEAKMLSAQREFEAKGQPARIRK